MSDCDKDKNGVAEIYICIKLDAATRKAYMRAKTIIDGAEKYSFEKDGIIAEDKINPSDIMEATIAPLKNDKRFGS